MRTTIEVSMRFEFPVFRPQAFRPLYSAAHILVRRQRQNPNRKRGRFSSRDCIVPELTHGGGRRQGDSPASATLPRGWKERVTQQP